MSSRNHSLYIVDIFVAMDKIHRYTNKFDNAQDLLNSELEWDATIRELEILGEATNYLLKSNHIDKKYRRIVDFRNQIIHGYFGIDENIDLFAPFKRVGNQSGVGLGLFLAKNAADALRANISIKNREDGKSGCVAKLILNNTSKND